MWANVFRVSGKQGTGTPIISSSRRTRLRLPPRRPPLPTPLAGHGRLGPFSSFAIRRFTSARIVSDGPSSSSSSSSSQAQAQTTTSFEDPSRKGLFYHLVPPPTPLSDSRPAFAVSLLADPPPSSESSTVLGWLPAETPGDDRVAGLNDFVENRALLFPPRLARLTPYALGELLTALRLVIHSALPPAPSQGDIRGTFGGRRRYPGGRCSSIGRGLDAHTW